MSRCLATVPRLDILAVFVDSTVVTMESMFYNRASVVLFICSHSTDASPPLSLPATLFPFAAMILVP
jgi:hypothetical protein